MRRPTPSANPAPRHEPPRALPRSLTRQPQRMALPAPAHRLLIALRAAVVIGRTGADPMPRMAELLGSKGAAREWMVLIAMAGSSWPEPVAVRPPCCAVMTHDETAMLDLLACAARHDRHAVDALLADLIDAAAREALFRAASLFVSAWAAARA